MIQFGETYIYESQYTTYEFVFSHITEDNLYVFDWKIPETGESNTDELWSKANIKRKIKSGRLYLKLSEAEKTISKNYAI